MMNTVIKAGVLLLFILTTHISNCFSQEIAGNAFEKSDLDSASKEISRIEERLFTDNTPDLLPEIEAQIRFWELYYETTGKLAGLHIYSYMLYAIHKFDMVHYDKNEYIKVLEYCDKALSLLELNNISEHHKIYIYAENIKLWCHHFLFDYKSPYKEYEFPGWIPVIMHYDSFPVYHISSNESKYESSLLTELCASAERYRERNYHHDELFHLLTAKELYNHVYKKKEDFYYFHIAYRIAEAYASLGEYEKATEYMEDFCRYFSNDTAIYSGSFRAMAEDKLADYKENTQYGQQIIEQTNEYYRKKKIKKFQKHTELVKSYYGPNSLIYEKSVTKLAELYNLKILEHFINKNWKNVRKYQTLAARYTKETIAAFREGIHTRFPLLPYNERYLYSQKRLAWMENYLPITTLFNGTLTDSYETFYDALLLCKGLNWRLLAGMNMSVATDTIQDDTDKLIHTSESGYMDFVNYRWKDVADNLEKDMTAIEFFNFKLLEKEVYIAAVIRHGSKRPELVYLFQKKLFDTISPDDYYNSNLLYDLVWKKLEPHTNPGGRIYFSPSGVLNRISIESVTDSAGTRASAKWNIYRVSSTREIIKGKERKSGTPSAVLYGWINYGLTDNNASRILDYREDESFEARAALYKSQYKDLPNTRIEIEEIKELLDSHTIPFKTYERETASEESFKDLSMKGNSIIHIATHGFYWREKNKANIYETPDKDSIISTLDESMKRSGLLFSGVNKALNDSTASRILNDGILTAYEIAKLNLTGCDIVVLSACETALGDIYTAEGVYGLQRGFKMAGVNSILMSLWKVDDAATMMLMTEFYRNFLSGMSKRESLLEAQDKVRNFRGYINGEKRKFSDPKYWAGFILLDALD